MTESPAMALMSDAPDCGSWRAVAMDEVSHVHSNKTAVEFLNRVPEAPDGRELLCAMFVTSNPEGAPRQLKNKRTN